MLCIVIIVFCAININNIENVCLQLTSRPILYIHITSHQQSCLGGVINPDWVNVLYCHLITS